MITPDHIWLPHNIQGMIPDFLCLYKLNIQQLYDWILKIFIDEMYWNIHNQLIPSVITDITFDNVNIAVYFQLWQPRKMMSIMYLICQWYLNFSPIILLLSLEMLHFFRQFQRMFRIISNTLRNHFLLIIVLRLLIRISWSRSLGITLSN